MLVTEVEMLLWHEDKAEMAKMLEWLTTREKFLFDMKQRASYGLPAERSEWDEGDVRVDRKCRTGAYIDLRFTMLTYAYPHHLARILRDGGWKIKGGWRAHWVAMSATWADMPRFTGDWTQLSDPDFPALWGAGADRARQEGRRGFGMLHVDDSAGQDSFVRELQTKVLALYTLMTARDAVAVPSGGFETQIRACLMLFFIDHGRQQFVSRNDEERVTYRRARQLVPNILAKAATMRDDKARYSLGVQAAFDDLKRYVWEVLGLKA